MTISRLKFKENSNNTANQNQNICALAVAQYLRVDKKVRYLHKLPDLIRAARFDFKVVSRMTAAKAKGKSVGAIRKNLAAIGAMLFIVRVDGHVMLLHGNGETLIDTAPRKRDRRKVTHVYAIYPLSMFS
jgi:hypothetical protein